MSVSHHGLTRSFFSTGCFLWQPPIGHNLAAVTQRNAKDYAFLANGARGPLHRISELGQALGDLHDLHVQFADAFGGCDDPVALTQEFTTR